MNEMSLYVNGNSMRCYQCASYKAETEREQNQWWDGYCHNGSHCRTHNTKCPAKVGGRQMACFDAELPDVDQVRMEDIR